jgi:hypothetical protein
MNIPEYAAHRNCTKQHISAIIKGGRLTGAVRKRGGRYIIDPAKADAILEASRDPAHPPVARPPKIEKPKQQPPADKPKTEKQPKQKRLEAIPVEEKIQVVKGSGLNLKITYAEARTLNEQYKAALKKAEYDRLMGKSLDAEEHYLKLFDIARRVRDQCLAIADRCAPVVAVESDQHVCKELLLKEIRYIVEGLRQDIEGLRG